MLNHDELLAAVRAKYGERFGIGVSTDSDIGEIIAVGRNGFDVLWRDGQRTTCDLRRYEWGDDKRDYVSAVDWHDLPRELKIQDVFDRVRGWNPREHGPVWRELMPQPMNYGISNDTPTFVKMDELQFRLEDDGRVTCEGVVVQAPQRR